MLELEPADGGSNGILGQPLFEQYYVLHETPSHPAPPRMGFAPIAGCGAGPPTAPTDLRTAYPVQSVAVLPATAVTAVTASQPAVAAAAHAGGSKAVTASHAAPLLALLVLSGILLGIVSWRRAQAAHQNIDEPASAAYVLWSTAQAP